MFTLTPTAAEQILNAAESQQPDPSDAGALPMLRLAAKIDEDGEIVYGMGFDEERENDLVLVSAGVTLLIAPRSQELLAGATLDFVELHPGEFQFIFVNPNERPSGCDSGGCHSCGSNGGCG